LLLGEKIKDGLNQWESKKKKEILDICNGKFSDCDGDGNGVGNLSSE